MGEPDSSVAADPAEIETKVKKSLEGTPFEASTLKLLTGGSVNWTYAATLVNPLDDGTKQIMVKHAEDRMKARPEQVLPLDRATREVACFKSLSEAHLTGKTGQKDSNSITVRTPKYHHFDEENANQLVEYMPQGINLKDYMLKYYDQSIPEFLEPTAREIGKSIGLWLRKFAHWSAQNGELQTIAKDNQLGRYFRHFVEFTWLKDRVEEHPSILGEVKELFEKVEQAASAELDDPEKVQVIHGDFWIGNILLPDAPINQGGNNVTMFVIDWEMMHLNVPSTDLGMMIAELYALWLLRSMRSGLWMLESLVDAYGEVTEAAAFRTAIQVGAHLVCVICEKGLWPQEETEKVVTIGRDIIVNAWNKNRDWFEKSELSCIFCRVK